MLQLDAAAEMFLGTCRERQYSAPSSLSMCTVAADCAVFLTLA